MIYSILVVVSLLLFIFYLLMDMHLLFSCRTLDDDELFGDHCQFSISELVEISSFLNRLVYQLIMEGLSSIPFFTHAHALLILMYTRDCRRSFTEPNHWLLTCVVLHLLFKYCTYI